MVKTVNDSVACTPFPTHAVEAQTTAQGFVYAAARTNLVPLKVLAAYDKLGLKAGDTVYAPLEYSNQPWGKTRLSAAGIEFILLPADKVFLVDTKDA